MDELNFRRKLYANPNDHSEEIVEACQHDKNKAKFRNDMLDFDDKLTKALNVDTPDNLAERILLNQGLTNKQQKRDRIKSRFAIAASFVAAIGLTIGVSKYSPNHSGVVEHAIAHMISELDHIPENGERSLSQLNDKLAFFGGHLLEQIGKIKFVSFCTFEGTKSLHIVMEDQGKDVTVFVVPKEAGLENDQNASLNGYSGTSYSSKNADIVVVSDNVTTSNNWTQKLTTALTWQKA